MEVSIILRSKNEKNWLAYSLTEIYKQKFKKKFEVILVDNDSKDGTKEFIKNNFKKVKIINYKSKIFYPGESLNFGVKKSKGKFIAFISAHCIPKNENWLVTLYNSISRNKYIAGVYGKQEPLDFSSPQVVRELTYLFGNQKKIQKNDPFFHNANSMIKRSVWDKIKFNSEVLHIEDRIWANKVLNLGLKIIYQPKASVLHYHGVGHDSNFSRSLNISNLLRKEKIQEIKNERIIAMIAIKEPFILKNGDYLLNSLLNELCNLSFLKKIFIFCNDKKLPKKFNSKKVLFLKRHDSIDKDYLGSDYFLKESYKKFIKKKYMPSHILVVEEIYPLRPKNFFLKLKNEISNNFDSIVPFVKVLDHNLWKLNNETNSLEPLFKTTLPSKIVDHKVFKEIKGIGTLTRSEVFETSGRESDRIKPLFMHSKYDFRISKPIKIS